MLFLVFEVVWVCFVIGSHSRSDHRHIAHTCCLQRLGCTEDIPDTGLPVSEDFQLNDFFAKIDWHALLEKKMTPP